MSYTERGWILNFLAARFFVPVALWRSPPTWESFQDRTVRWGKKDADEKVKDLAAGSISQAVDKAASAMSSKKDAQRFRDDFCVEWPK